MLAPRRPTMPRFGGATPVKFDPRSLALLGQANPVLAQILRETERRAADRGITLGVGEVKRSPARQAEMVVTGKSQTYNSRHLNGSAADLVIKGPDGKPNWDFEAYRPVAAIAKEVAAEQGVPDFVWGGDWKTLKDGVHFQVGGPVKGNQAGKDTLTGGRVIAPGGETDKLQTGGLLSRILPQENGQSAFWNKVPGLSDPDKRAKLALALDGMTLNPNQGLQKGLVADIEGRAQTKQRNATAEWLRSQGNEELAAAVEAGSLAGDQAIGLHYEQRKPVEPPTTDDIKEYERAKAEGYAGNFQDWMLETRRASASNNNVSVGAGETQFQKTTGEALAKQADEIVRQGAEAQRNLGRIITLEGALANAPQGLAGGLAGWASSLGIKTEGSSDLELANAIISQLVPEQRAPGSGTMSDGDVAMFKRSLPALMNTPEGNQKIIATLKAVAKYDIERAKIAQQVQLGKMTTADAFDAYGALGNPLADFVDDGTKDDGGWQVIDGVKIRVKP